MFDVDQDVDQDDQQIWELTEAAHGEVAGPVDFTLLGEVDTGVMLAAVLSFVDVEAVSGGDRVRVLKACQRMVSHYQALVYRSMSAVADAVVEGEGDSDSDLAEQAASAEIASALCLTRRAADSELGLARTYQVRLPEVWDALAAGVLDRRRANLVAYQTSHLTESQARQVARRVLEKASGLTTGGLTAYLKKLAVETDPEDASIRYRVAVEDRRVTLEATTEGTAHLHLWDLPAERAVRIRNHLHQTALHLKRDGETRSMDQLRADIATDLLEGKSTDCRRGSVTLTVELSTLTQLTDHAGDLAGYGPVVADIARQIAASNHKAEWRYQITDQSQPIAVGTTRRRPNQHTRRIVETLSPTCIFPGCRTPAHQCDLDHTKPWIEGGHTTADNLRPLCRHHHQLRHNTGWQYQITTAGNHQWTSPLQHRYTTTPRAP